MITLEWIQSVTMVIIQDEKDNLQDKIFKAICLLQESAIIKLCKEKKICEGWDRLLYDEVQALLLFSPIFISIVFQG